MQIKEIDLEFKRALFRDNVDQLRYAYKEMRNLCLTKLNEKNLKIGNLERMVKRLKREVRHDLDLLFSFFMAGIFVGTLSMVLVVVWWLM